MIFDKEHLQVTSCSITVFPLPSPLSIALFPFNPYSLPSSPTYVMPAVK
jgi:hypothetical protein